MTKLSKILKKNFKENISKNNEKNITIRENLAIVDDKLTRFKEELINRGHLDYDAEQFKDNIETNEDYFESISLCVAKKAVEVVRTIDNTLLDMGISKEIINEAYSEVSEI